MITTYCSKYNILLYYVHRGNSAGGHKVDPTPPNFPLSEVKVRRVRQIPQSLKPKGRGKKLILKKAGRIFLHHSWVEYFPGFTRMDTDETAACIASLYEALARRPDGWPRIIEKIAP